MSDTEKLAVLRVATRKIESRQRAQYEALTHAKAEMTTIANLLEDATNRFDTLAEKIDRLLKAGTPND